MVDKATRQAPYDLLDSIWNMVWDGVMTTFVYTLLSIVLCFLAAICIFTFPMWGLFWLIGYFTKGDSNV